MMRLSSMLLLVACVLAACKTQTQRSPEPRDIKKETATQKTGRGDINKEPTMKQREQVVSIDIQVEVTAPPPGSGEVPKHTTLVYVKTTDDQKEPELFYLAALKDLTGKLNKKLAALGKTPKGVLTVRDKAVVGVEVSPESCCLYLVRER